MMQIYQGVDILQIGKFREIFTRNENLIPDIFTEKEREYCLSFNDPYSHFAGRFASKEACLKALGKGVSGFGIDHVFLEIEVISRASGRPQLLLSGWIERIAKRRGITQFTVSISHSSEYCVATVILVGI